jgi:hypothetical protein
MSLQSPERTTVSLETPTLVDTNAAADILRTKPATLVLWRCTRRYDLPFVKIGRLVLYDVRDLAEFVERRKVRRTEPTLTAGSVSLERRSQQSQATSGNNESPSATERPRGVVLSPSGAEEFGVKRKDST